MTHQGFSVGTPDFFAATLSSAGQPQVAPMMAAAPQPQSSLLGGSRESDHSTSSQQQQQQQQQMFGQVVYQQHSPQQHPFGGGFAGSGEGEHHRSPGYYARGGAASNATAAATTTSGGGGNSDVGRRNLFVAGLDRNIGDALLQALFARFGVVQSCKVMLDIVTGQSRGFGFVLFSESAHAERAIRALDGQTIYLKKTFTSAGPPASESAEDLQQLQLVQGGVSANCECSWELDEGSAAAAAAANGGGGNGSNTCLLPVRLQVQYSSHRGENLMCESPNVRVRNIPESVTDADLALFLKEKHGVVVHSVQPAPIAAYEQQQRVLLGGSQQQIGGSGALNGSSGGGRRVVLTCASPEHARMAVAALHGKQCWDACTVPLLAKIEEPHSLRLQRLKGMRDSQGGGSSRGGSLNASQQSLPGSPPSRVPIVASPPQAAYYSPHHHHHHHHHQVYAVHHHHHHMPAPHHVYAGGAPSATAFMYGGAPAIAPQQQYIAAPLPPGAQPSPGFPTLLSPQGVPMQLVPIPAGFAAPPGAQVFTLPVQQQPPPQHHHHHHHHHHPRAHHHHHHHHGFSHQHHGFSSQPAQQQQQAPPPPQQQQQQMPTGWGR